MLLYTSITRSRTAIGKLLFGILGNGSEVKAILTSWNEQFRTKGIDASMDRYDAKKETLPEVLSEMFHFDRRGYIVTFALQEVIKSLMDSLDPSAAGEGRVDTVVNDSGHLTGYFLRDDDAKRWKLWIGDS